MSKPFTLFLVDDDTDDVALFQEVLLEASPSTLFQSAKDGEDALQKLSGASPLPDLIFLDLNMPRMGGKECLAHIKNNEVLRHIPVIMYTTSSLSKDIEETMLSGAVCFITKPSSSNELKHILSSIIGSMPHNLKRTLQHLSDNANTFIVCWCFSFDRNQVTEQII